MCGQQQCRHAQTEVFRILASNRRDLARDGAGRDVRAGTEEAAAAARNGTRLVEIIATALAAILCSTRPRRAP
jgi:hypothetical protein